MKIDFVVGISYGDESKGKFSKILNEKYNYSAVIKYNGSGNAGHAVYIGEKKYTAHYLTSGIYDKNTKIVIGPGCVLNPDEFLKEFNIFDKEFELRGRTFIHPYSHIITNKHIEIDKKENKIGTTNKGNGPCYSDKYKRTGIRAKSVKELKEFILSDEIVRNIMKIRPTITSGQGRILMEGSQGWWLDIDHGNYPYVTSSHIHPGFAFTTFGIPLSFLGDVYGVCKIYDTYVGNSENIVKCNKNDEEIIRKIGEEYGETTKRPRKIGYLNINKLIDAINHIGIQYLLINKIDVLEKIKIFKVIFDDEIIEFNSLDKMKKFIIDKLIFFTNVYEKNIYFSGKKNGNDIYLN